MGKKRFDPKNLNKLNNPSRLAEFPAEFILKIGRIRNPGVIIDIGAGTGFFSAAFARIHDRCKIYACDISEVMISWMRENIVPKFKNIIPLLMEEDKIGLTDNTADLVFMVNLHHELDNPEKTLKECCRLLKPGGTIAVSDWKKEKTEHGPPVEIRYTPDEVRNQITEAGFKDICVFTDFPNNFLVTAEKDAGNIITGEADNA